MFVCLCEGVTDRDIHAALDEGCQSIPDVIACTGAGSGCGACHETIATIVARRSETETEAEGNGPTSSRRRLDMAPACPRISTAA
jgi:bacterioferritin-associated ferredoxin